MTTRTRGLLDRTAITVASTIRPAAAPRLEHHDGPQRIGPVSPAAQMFGPQISCGGNVDKPATKPRCIQHVFGPVPQGSAQPVREWNAKTHLRPGQQLPWYHLFGDAAQQPFGLT